MNDLLTAAFATPNIVFTILLGVICLYWLTVILGVVGLDAFDFDVDMDMDVDIDVDVDVDLDVDADVDVEANADVSSITAGSMVLGSLRFFNLGRVPFMVLLSMFILSMWSFSIYCNHADSWINPDISATIAALLLLPITMASLFTTKLLTMPLSPFIQTRQQLCKTAGY